MSSLANSSEYHRDVDNVPRYAMSGTNPSSGTIAGHPFEQSYELRLNVVSWNGNLMALLSLWMLPAVVRGNCLPFKGTWSSNDSPKKMTLTKLGFASLRPHPFLHCRIINSFKRETLILKGSSSPFCIRSSASILKVWRLPKGGMTVIWQVGYLLFILVAMCGLLM